MEQLQSEMQTMMYAMYGLEVMGIGVVIAALVHLVFHPLYKKHFGQRYRVKTVIVHGCASHYYAEFKPGWDYNWGTIDMYESGNYQVTSDQDSVIPFETFDQAEKRCCGYKEYRMPTKPQLDEETYTDVCDQD